ncbi:hypothetical protein [Geotoga petraea]|uniref:Uncharacterized protein n=1 Tax=Geotoga petraea TaxID=28234 RepID=A0A4Z0VZ03_9BACT|nr:hypothetical protein [Geotoga petraea]TGG88033.1 hypothetical protein E4650_06735 [Geotoga petraea]
MINNMDDFIKYLDTLSNEELREEMESFGIEFKENNELYDFKKEKNIKRKTRNQRFCWRIEEVNYDFYKKLIKVLYNRHRRN